MPRVQNLRYIDDNLTWIYTAGIFGNAFSAICKWFVFTIVAIFVDNVKFIENALSLKAWMYFYYLINILYLAIQVLYQSQSVSYAFKKYIMYV